MTSPATTSPPLRSLDGRRIVLTGTSSAAIRIGDARTSAGGQVYRITDGFGSEAAVEQALGKAKTALGGVDQVVHAWLPESVMAAASFMSLSEHAWADGCEAALSGAW